MKPNYFIYFLFNLEPKFVLKVWNQIRLNCKVSRHTSSHNRSFCFFFLRQTKTDVNNISNNTDLKPAILHIINKKHRNRAASKNPVSVPELQDQSKNAPEN